MQLQFSPLAGTSYVTELNVVPCDWMRWLLSPDCHKRVPPLNLYDRSYTSSRKQTPVCSGA